MEYPSSKELLRQSVGSLTAVAQYRFFKDFFLFSTMVDEAWDLVICDCDTVYRAEEDLCGSNV